MRLRRTIEGEDNAARPRATSPAIVNCAAIPSMRKNITVIISEQTYRDVRVWCARRNASVSEVVEAYLRDLCRRHFKEPGAPS
jgi:hypothetical protein